MKRLVYLSLVYVLFTGSSCPGPALEPFDCLAEEEAASIESNGKKAPFYRIKARQTNATRQAEAAGENPRYIVTMKPSSTSGVQATSIEARTAELASMANSFGGQDVKIFAAMGQFSCRLTKGQRSRVRRDPRVLFVEHDGFKQVSPRVGSETSVWGLDRIDQRALPLDSRFDPDGTGAEIHAYVIDTGVDSDHPEFEDRLGESFSAFNDRIDDDHGHGTHVAGTVGGKTFGVAREVVIHAVRVLRDGSGADSDVIEGIDWATDHALANGWPAVSNMSLGGDGSRSLDTAVCRSIAAGVVHVVAAGNDNGNACAGSPARVKQALGMGATDKRDDRAFFSNRGLCVDAFGPGVDVVSARRGGGSTVLSGTSMASPHGAGVAALVLERNPGATPEEIKQLIESNATPDVVDSPGTDSANRLLYARDDG